MILCNLKPQLALNQYHIFRKALVTQAVPCWTYIHVWTFAASVGFISSRQLSLSNGCSRFTTCCPSFKLCFGNSIYLFITKRSANISWSAHLDPVSQFRLILNSQSLPPTWELVSPSCSGVLRTCWEWGLTCSLFVQNLHLLFKLQGLNL